MEIFSLAATLISIPIIVTAIYLQVRLSTLSYTSPGWRRCFYYGITLSLGLLLRGIMDVMVHVHWLSDLHWIVNDTFLTIVNPVLLLLSLVELWRIFVRDRQQI